VNGLDRIRGPGTTWRYQYRYADPREVGPRQPLQTEFWIPKGRKGGAWVAGLTDPSVQTRTRRKVFPNHSPADKLAHSIARVAAGGYATSADAQCDAYLAWAREKGFATVSVYAPKVGPTAKGWYGARCAKALGFQLRAVDPADIHGPAPTAEIEP
jgi:hypothetical protein